MEWAINIEPFDFQCKLRRVIRYLRLKDQKCKTVKPTSPDEEDVVDSLGKSEWKSFDCFLLLFRGSNFINFSGFKKNLFRGAFHKNFERSFTEQLNFGFETSLMNMHLLLLVTVAVKSSSPFVARGRVLTGHHWCLDNLWPCTNA